jgi:hypothetical protein
MTSIINRREALQRVAALMGGAISAPAMLGFLNGCSAKKPEAGWKPVFLTESQAAVVTEIAEIMIPHTDTPGATELGVPGFIDTMLKDVYAKDDQDRFFAGFKAFEAQSQSEYGREFLKLEPTQRATLVKSSHDVAVEEAKKKLVTASRRDVNRPFILMVKELTLLGYFTSEVGATQVLQYIQVPGAYVACMPIAKAGTGKTWATETSTPF